MSSLVDRAFATQTAFVRCADSLSKQMQALTSLNTHLMNVCQVQHSPQGPQGLGFIILHGIPLNGLNTASQTILLA